MLDSELLPARIPDSRRQLLVLHGLGDSMEGYRWLPEALGLDWLNYRLVNAPDSYYMGYSWYDIYNDPAPGITRSRTLLMEWLDQLAAEGWPAEQTAVFGFSQGCVLTLEIGARHPHRLAGLVGISGYVHQLDNLLAEASPAAPQQHFLITHGTRDPLLPFETSRKQAEQLKAAGLQVEWHEFDKEHTIQGMEEIAVIRQFLKRSFEA